MEAGQRSQGGGRGRVVGSPVCGVGRPQDVPGSRLGHGYRHHHCAEVTEGHSVDGTWERMTSSKRRLKRMINVGSSSYQQHFPPSGGRRGAGGVPWPSIFFVWHSALHRQPTVVGWVMCQAVKIVSIIMQLTQWMTTNSTLAPS